MLLLFGRPFLVTVGAVLEMHLNKLSLANIDKNVVYNHVPPNRAMHIVSYIGIYDDPF